MFFCSCVHAQHFLFRGNLAKLSGYGCMKRNAWQGFWSFYLKVRWSAKDQCALGDGKDMSLLWKGRLNCSASRKVELSLRSIYNSFPAYPGTVPLTPRVGMFPSHMGIKERRCELIFFLFGLVRLRERNFSENLEGLRGKWWDVGSFGLEKLHWAGYQ